MLTKHLLANIGDQEYNSWLTELNLENKDIIKYESPFTAVAEGGMRTVSSAAIYKSLKQRRPMTMEYFEKPGDTKPKSITLYINPERLQISNQKIVKKQITRGGIFYHHFGADHSTMALNGSTGLSGMAGIKQLEEIYHASGTLLRYNNFMPNQVYQSIEDYEIIDYKDPITTVESVMNNQISPSMVNNIQSKLLTEGLIPNNSSTNNTVYSANNLLELYKKNEVLTQFIQNSLPQLYSNLQKNSNSSEVFRLFYQKLINDIFKILPNFNSAIIVQLAYEMAFPKLSESKPLVEKQTITRNNPEEMLTKTMNFENARKTALKNHMEKLKNFQMREQKIKDILESNVLKTNENFKDEWAPRQIMIYFENRVYIGHFNAFSYQRDAKTNLITYELRFTITSQYEFNNEDDPNAGQQQEIKIEITPKKIEETPEKKDPPPKEKADPKPNKNLYTVVAGDTLGKIAKKFFGDDKYWSEIYAANVNSIRAYYNPKPATYADIYPGQQLVIPKLPSGYRNWVVLEGDTLRYLAERFYKDGNKWTKIDSANKGIIKANYTIYPKMILKIPT